MKGVPKVLVLHITKDAKLSFVALSGEKYKRIASAGFLILLLVCLVRFVFSTGFLPVPNSQSLFKSGFIDDAAIWSHWSSKTPGNITGRLVTERTIPAHEKPAPEPATRRLVPVDYDPFSKNTYYNRNYGFWIQFLEGWQVKERRIDGCFTVSSTDSTGASINVVVRKLAPDFQNANLDNYSEKQLTDFIRGIFSNTKERYPDAILADSGIRRLAKRKAVFLTTKYSDLANSKRIYVQNIQIITFDKGKTFVVGGTSLTENHAAFEKEFQKVAASFSLQ